MKVAVLGQPKLNNIHHIMNTSDKPILINPNIVEIEGEQYEPRPSSRPEIGRKLGQIVMMTQMMAGMSGFGGRREKERPKVDIIEEYKLIRQKKSKLSSNGREWVKWQFESNFKLVKKEE